MVVHGRLRVWAAQELGRGAPVRSRPHGGKPGLRRRRIIDREGQSVIPGKRNQQVPIAHTPNTFVTQAIAVH